MDIPYISIVNRDSQVEPCKDAKRKSPSSSIASIVWLWLRRAESATPCRVCDIEAAEDGGSVPLLELRRANSL